MNLLPPFARAALAICAACWFNGPSSAQEPGQPTMWPQTLPPQDPTKPQLLPNPADILLRGQGVHPRFRRGDLSSPAFQGLPVLAPPGFGAYPGGQLPVPFETPGVAAPAVPIEPRSANAWPTWLPGSREGEEGFAADIAIIAQTTDYVWIREPGERAFVPLAYWDRFRIATAGTSIDVRGGGQFVMVFQRGALLRVAGRSRLEIEKLDEESSEVGMDDLTRVIATAAERPLHIRLGAAGTLEIVASRVSITRERGMVHATNLGPGDALFRGPDREVAVPAGYRTTLLPALAAEGPSGRLALEGDVGTSRDGRVLLAEGSGAGGELSWSGARFRLPQGAVLRIDPLAGTAFPGGFHSDQ